MVAWAVGAVFLPFLLSLGLGCRSEPLPEAPPRPPAPRASTGDASRPDAEPNQRDVAPVDAAKPLTVAGAPLAWRDRKRYPNVSAVCRDFMAVARRSKPPAYLLPTDPACKVLKLPFSFVPDAAVRSIHGVAFDSGTQDWSMLVIELAADGGAGFFVTPITWDYYDPDASQHPPHPGSIESVTVEGGRLIAVVGTEEGWSAPGAPNPKQRPDGTWDVTGHEMRLARGVVVCDVAAARPSCIEYLPPAAEPILGLKKQPLPVPWPGTPWSKLPWDGPTPAYEIGKEGTLVVKR